MAFESPPDKDGSSLASPFDQQLWLKKCAPKEKLSALTSVNHVEKTVAIFAIFPFRFGKFARKLFNFRAFAKNPDIATKIFL